jgi:hypothetical protein
MENDKYLVPLILLVRTYFELINVQLVYSIRFRFQFLFLMNINAGIYIVYINIGTWFSFESGIFDWPFSAKILSCLCIIGSDIRVHMKSEAFLQDTLLNFEFNFCSSIFIVIKFESNKYKSYYLLLLQW